MKEEIGRGYYDNGQIWYETIYINRKAHGLAKRWHNNGQFAYKITFKNEIQCGARVVFIY